MNRTEYLMHHGIKGQKWGQRNGPPYPISRQSRFGGNGKNKKGTTNNTAGSIIKKKPKAKMSNELRNERREALSRVYDMSDEELERRVNRLKKEEDLKRLTQQSTETKLDKAKNYIFKIRDRAINRVTDKAVDATINEGKKNVDRLLRSNASIGTARFEMQRIKDFRNQYETAIQEADRLKFKDKAPRREWIKAYKKADKYKQKGDFIESGLNKRIKNIKQYIPNYKEKPNSPNSLFDFDDLDIIDIEINNKSFRDEYGISDADWKTWIKNRG